MTDSMSIEDEQDQGLCGSSENGGTEMGKEVVTIEDMSEDLNRFVRSRTLAGVNYRHTYA
jgi:hypothetical protein